MDMEKTGTYLASLRRGRDMTQQQVADILGVSNKTVSKWESGAGLPDIAALPALAALYGVTADDILAGETRPRACADTPAEVEAYLERRGSLRFRIGYSLAVMALAVWVAFPYNNWSWLCLLASPLCLWLGWGVCRSRETLRRRILLLIPLCALWLFAAIQLLGVWRLLVSAYALHGGVVRQFSWAALTVRQEGVWLLLPLLCGVFLVESFSVMMQVGWFKYTKRRYGEGRRILLMSPVHHHYQKKGIFETKIVLRFWIISLLLAAITLVTLKIR